MKMNKTANPLSILDKVIKLVCPSKTSGNQDYG
jgi:hypothetical protein